MDPPWKQTGCTLGYKTIDDEIWMKPINLNLLMDNGYMGIWVSNKKVPNGLLYMLKSDFQYVELITWVKIDEYLVVQKKVGFYLLHSTEYCIVGMKRMPGVKIEDFTNRCKSSNLIFAKTRMVSHKPDELYEVFEKLVKKGPYLEIFARKHNNRKGWDKIGDESICYKNEAVQDEVDFNLQ